jgi:hypothetical protein
MHPFLGRFLFPLSLYRSLPPHPSQYVETDMQQLQIKQRHEPRAEQEQVRRGGGGLLP